MAGKGGGAMPPLFASHAAAQQKNSPGRPAVVARHAVATAVVRRATPSTPLPRPGRRWGGEAAGGGRHEQAAAGSAAWRARYQTAYRRSPARPTAARRRSGGTRVRSPSPARSATRHAAEVVHQRRPRQRVAAAGAAQQRGGQRQRRRWRRRRRQAARAAAAWHSGTAGGASAKGEAQEEQPAASRSSAQWWRMRRQGIVEGRGGW